MKPLNVRLCAHAYPVMIERGALDRLGTVLTEQGGRSRVFLVTDETVWGCYGVRVSAALANAGVAFHAEVLPPGEQSKSGEMLFRLYGALARLGLSRSDWVVALGGGVMGDLAGMAAATYLRGMRFAQVPTTLLAQVDSSIGGKVAVDLPEGKNLVGAFYQPQFVLIDPDVLDTLSDEQFSSGMGEVVKHGAIADEGLFSLLERHAGRAALRRSMPAVIRRNLMIKRDVVRRDEREEGPRMVLNFGHTIGHALEKRAGYVGISHGAAIAAGMAHITRRSEQRGFTQPGTAARLAALLSSFGLPVELPGGPEGLLDAMLRDKKVRGDTITLVLLRKIGQAELHTINTSDLELFV